MGAEKMRKMREAEDRRGDKVEVVTHVHQKTYECGECDNRFPRKLIFKKTKATDF